MSSKCIKIIEYIRKNRQNKSNVGEKIDISFLFIVIIYSLLVIVLAVLSILSAEELEVYPIVVMAIAIGILIIPALTVIGNIKKRKAGIEEDKDFASRLRNEKKLDIATTKAMIVELEKDISDRWKKVTLAFAPLMALIFYFRDSFLSYLVNTMVVGFILSMLVLMILVILITAVFIFVYWNKGYLTVLKNVEYSFYDNKLLGTGHMPMKVRVIIDHLKEGDFPIFPEGTTVKLLGKECKHFLHWFPCEISGYKTYIPESFLSEALLNREYNPTELMVSKGEELEVLEIVNAWLIAKTSDGEIGWIPAESVISM